MNSHDESITSADGTRLVVRRLGTGDPVVLVHGSGGGLHSWATVAEHLAHHHEVWLPARRGYGPSDVPPGRKSFADETGDLIAVLAAARRPSGKPVHLVGASYGATLALHTTAVDPRDVRSLAVFEPPLYAAGAETAALLDTYRAAFERADAEAMAAALNGVTRVPAKIVAALTAAAATQRPDPVEARRSAVGWLHDLEALAGDSTDTARWSSITVPTLLLSGADTWEPMPTTMRALATAIPAARHVVWAGQSHFVTRTAPALVADALRQFFAELPA
ncbi:alpha/beta fold hydrolase [Micromonospora tarensis]|uniref:Alpha/beta fold hydrolase n=1 Tax=Micromonospora tarensis TaxID=2806100 RepID=A0ABS1YAJ3_9ACTN|nr:alpha/beta fold hydrolase [Micromonospora tarensis]MBM0274393.1 alpha/beta fold hydrolase [Micromonospora tarensis]